MELENKFSRRCKITLKCGKEFIVAGEFATHLEEWAEALRTQNKVPNNP